MCPWSVKRWCADWAEFRGRTSKCFGTKARADYPRTRLGRRQRETRHCLASWRVGTPRSSAWIEFRPLYRCGQRGLGKGHLATPGIGKSALSQLCDIHQGSRTTHRSVSLSNFQVPNPILSSPFKVSGDAHKGVSKDRLAAMSKSGRQPTEECPRCQNLDQRGIGDHALEEPADGVVSTFAPGTAPKVAKESFL